MKSSFGVVFGWCGWGVHLGLFPAVRLGIVHLWCCRGSIIYRFVAVRQALADAREELRRGEK